MLAQAVVEAAHPRNGVVIGVVEEVSIRPGESNVYELQVSAKVREKRPGVNSCVWIAPEYVRRVENEQGGRGADPISGVQASFEAGSDRGGLLRPFGSAGVADPAGGGEDPAGADGKELQKGVETSCGNG
jgi:hypothetical protein